jgi:hypothetical protein
MVEIKAEPKQESRPTLAMLSLAIVLTMVAIVRVGIWREHTPQPPPLSDQLVKSMQNAGWTLRARQPQARTGEDLSWARGVELIAKKQNSHVILNLVPVQARGPKTFKIETLIKPVLGEKQWKTTVIRFRENQRVELNNSKRSGVQPVAEAACWANDRALSRNIDLLTNKLEHQRVVSIKEQIERFAGFRQTREWDCLLIVIRQASKSDSEATWSDVIKQLISARQLYQ